MNSHRPADLLPSRVGWDLLDHVHATVWSSSRAILDTGTYLLVITSWCWTHSVCSCLLLRSLSVLHFHRTCLPSQVKACMRRMYSMLMLSLESNALFDSIFWVCTLSKFLK